MPSTEYDPKAWSRIPEYGEDMAADLYHQPSHVVPTVVGLTNPGDSILEVGCGGQGYANQFKGTGLKYVGLDITPEYLKLAKAKFPEFQFVEGDARKMPFEDKSFEVSFCNNVFLHLTPEDAMSVFREMLRVSKRAVMAISMFATDDVQATKRSGYPEEDGTYSEFLFNTFAWKRFLVPGWVSYSAPPTSILLISMETTMRVEAVVGLREDFP